MGDLNYVNSWCNNKILLLNTGIRCMSQHKNQDQSFVVAHTDPQLITSMITSDCISNIVSFYFYV